MNCPECGIEQLCPCKSCAKNNEGKTVWVWEDNGEVIHCGGCGFAAHVDQWEEWSMQQAAAADELQKVVGR